MADASDRIVIEHDGGVCAIGIDRPDKKNALTAAMYAALAEAFASAAADPDVRVVFLHGSEECFTAGNDLTDFAKNPPTSITSPVYQFLLAISQCEKPILAGVAGHAVGIGTTALLHCDVVVAADNATFSVPFTDLGLCPEAGASVLLTATVGLKKASEMLLFGSRVNAQEALACGLVNRVVPSGTVLHATRTLALELARKPSESVRLTKQMVKAPLAELVAITMKSEADEFMRRLHSPEAKEAFAAFAEKRPPRFS